MNIYEVNQVKKILALCLTISLCLCYLASCDSSTATKEISCEDIIKAYEDAGYYVTHGEHKDESESSQLCYIRVDLTEDTDSDYIYFTTYFTEEQAEEAAETDKYNLAVWLYATVSGESRWLKTGTYGKIEYSYYNPKLIKPFEDLIK